MQAATPPGSASAHLDGILDALKAGATVGVGHGVLVGARDGLLDAVLVVVLHSQQARVTCCRGCTGTASEHGLNSTEHIARVTTGHY